MAEADQRQGPKLAERTQVAEAARHRRLAEAMRENLLKRKRQQRAAAEAKSAGRDAAGDRGERD
jgi:hypothetical protein